MADKHWADISESTSTIGIRVMLAAHAIGGRYLFLPLLAPVIVFYFSFNTAARRAVRVYLQRLNRYNKATPAPTLSNCFRVFWRFGQALLDKFAVWQGDIQRDDVVIHQYEVVEQLRDSGQGAVILMSHLGNFEICHALSNASQGITLTVLVHTKHAQQFNALLKNVAGGSRVEILQVTEVDAAMAIRLAEKVNRGEFIAIAGDRVPINSRQVLQHQFLGETASFPKGPFILSAVLGKTVLMLNCLKQEGQYHIYFEQLWAGGSIARREREDFIQRLASGFVEQLQHYVLKAPYQWFNFFDFWRSPVEQKTP